MRQQWSEAKSERDENTGRSSSWREVLRITLPAFVELVMTSLFGMVDMIMVGQLSPAAIAAVGFTNQPFMLLLAVFAAVNVGATTLVAWNVGADRIDRVCSVTRQVLVINVVLGFVVSILGIIIARPVMAFMGANADTMDYAVSYFKIVSAGLLFQAVNIGITAALRGAGETRIPMLYNVSSNLMNVFGNYVLIYGKFGFPRWEVAGAAVSTTLSRGLACFIALFVVYKYRNTPIHIKLKEDYRIYADTFKKLFSIGMPAALEQFILQGGLMLYARTVSSLGTAGYAAHQIGINIANLTFSPSLAFGVAATTLVGQSLGANDEEGAKRCADLVHHMAIAVACFMGIVFILFSHPMARFYTQDIQVAAMAGTVLKILAIAQVGQSTQLSLAGALRGAGDTVYPLYASIIGIWGVRVLLGYVFVALFQWGLSGAWFALVIDQYVRSGIIFIRYRSGKWKHVKARSEKVREKLECI